MGPSIGGGEKEKTSRANKFGQNIFKQPFRILYPVEKVGGKNKIECAKVRQAKRVPGPKKNAFSRWFGEGYGSGRAGQVAFLLQLKRQGALRGNLFGGGDKSLGEIDPDHLRNFSR